MKMFLSRGSFGFSIYLLSFFCVLACRPPEPEVVEPENTKAYERKPFEPEMVAIKGGAFIMGTEDGAEFERPAHAVVVSDFEIGKYHVTHDEFAAFVEDTGYVTEAETIGSGRILRDGRFEYYPGFTWRQWNGPGSSPEGRGRHPVIQVSWNDAVVYCRWLSTQTGRAYRLPTEAEWEYACRGGTQTRYWWGDSLDTSKLNCREKWISGDSNEWPKDQHTLTTEVDAYPPNPFGLHDMLGNTWDWVVDYAVEDYYLQLTRMKTSPVVDPQGAARGTNRVLRGGGWNTPGSRLSCATRFINDPPEYRSDHVSFRVVRNP
jgi:formylglycine-generating enzyme required for sulfatase activity